MACRLQVYVTSNDINLYALCRKWVQNLPEEDVPIPEVVRACSLPLGASTCVHVKTLGRRTQRHARRPSRCSQNVINLAPLPPPDTSAQEEQPAPPTYSDPFTQQKYEAEVRRPQAVHGRAKPTLTLSLLITDGGAVVCVRTCVCRRR